MPSHLRLRCRSAVLALGAAVLLAAAWPSPLSADHVLFPFTELSDDDLARIDLHDGYLDDWQRVLGEPTFTAHSAWVGQGKSWTPHYDPSDLDFRIWLAWHDATNRLYFATGRIDDDYHNAFGGSSSSMSGQDGWMLVVVDGDRSGGRSFIYDFTDMTQTEQASAEVRFHQHWDALAETHGAGSHLSMHYEKYGDWCTRPPYADGGGRHFSLYPGVDLLEFYITPFDVLSFEGPDHSQVSDLYPGKRIGIFLLISDHDANGTLLYALSPEYGGIQLEFLPHGLMVGKSQAGTGLDGLAESTWAAVKHTAAPDSTAAGPTQD